MGKQKEHSRLKAEHILIILAIGLAPFLGNLDGSIVMIAGPVLEGVFSTNTSGVAMIIVVYLLVTASFALIFGRLGDIIGPERVFVMGFVVLTAGSLLCGLAPNLNSLIAFRVIQALGSTMLFSTYCAVVTMSLPDTVRGRAFGFVGVLGSIGFAVGAPVGGFILKVFTWHWLFLFNIPFGLAGLVLSRKLLGQRPALPQQSVVFDGWGGLLSLLGLLAFVYALKLGQNHGWGTSLTLALLGFSVVCFILFIMREKTYPAPLVDISIFKNFHFSLGVVSAFLVILLLNGVLFLFPYYLQLIKGLSTEKAGLVLMALPMAVFIFSPLAGCLCDNKSPCLIASVATLAILAACLFFVSLKTDTPIWSVLLPFVIFGVALAFFVVANITLVMSHAADGNQGVVSAILAVVNSIGALMGVAFFQIIFSFFVGGKAGQLDTIPARELMHGFHHAMLFALLLCIPALAASIVARERRPSPGPSPE